MTDFEEYRPIAEKLASLDPHEPYEPYESLDDFALRHVIGRMAIEVMYLRERLQDHLDDHFRGDV